MVQTGATLLHVDAFSKTAFSGNPAAVCLLEAAAVEPWMQAVAAEMNLSETAFVWRAVAGGDQQFVIRWFTPTVEVDLCGHATLASAHALWQLGRVLRTDPIHFESRSGRLGARWQDDEIVLDFPARSVARCSAPNGLIEGLGAMPLEVLRTGDDDLLVVVDDARTVRELRPSLDLLGALTARAIVVTAQGDQGEADDDARTADCVSRVFAPAVGVPEDPMTGSAHCALAVYWARRLRKEHLLGYQASRRGGWVRMHLDGDRVHLGGSAVTVARGTLMV